MSARSTIPRATYRLQMNHEFTFSRATEIVPYLASLGISHCYISPCLKARAGSMHGYDIVDHSRLNPEIGTPAEFDRFVTTLHENEMGLIMDIVPNHMAVLGSDNAWWLDVLENGEASSYANFFDIDWHPLKEELQGKVLVPVLHDHYGAVLESGELKLLFHPETGGFDVNYRSHRFPIGPKSYPLILEIASGQLAGEMGANDPDLLELQSLITAFRNLPSRQDLEPSRLSERSRDKEIHKKRLAEVGSRSAQIKDAIEQAVTTINGNSQDASSFELLHELIKAQTFRLANWRVATDDINYRRFFDTNDLAGVRVEDPQVFEATHKLVLSLVAEGKVDGLRVDHPDGLYNPAEYFERLAQNLRVSSPDPSMETRPAHYTVIEKILTGTERLQKDWPVSGTTGYEFSNLVNGLFVDPAAERRFDGIYRNFIDDDINLDEFKYSCRKLIIRIALVSELNVLANQLSRIALAKRRTCDFTLNSLRDALTEVVANFPVYRTYVTALGLSESDSLYIRTAIAAAKFRSLAGDPSVFDFLHQVLNTRIADEQDVAYRHAVMAFAMKFQQFTSPVMAKGLEDTAFYRYNRLVSVNDVGGDLDRFGVTSKDFHAANQERAKEWPHTMLATSTHDSKRSEDVRARIDVLSEIPGLWKLKLRDWERLNRRLKTRVAGQLAPSRNDEYLLYQTLLGAWPAENIEGEEASDHFRLRIQNYMSKAMREAKQKTSWINQNDEYEKAVSSFIEKTLHGGTDNRFLNEFIPFQKTVSRTGVWNSLSEVIFKLTSPGVPDIYQGNDWFDFSLVDPDNRRPVDYARRQSALHEFAGSESESEATDLAHLLETPEDGKLKLFVIWKTLCFRKAHSDLFSAGDYTPVAASGEKAGHVVAYLRAAGEKNMLVVAPRLIHGLLDGDEGPPVGSSIWKDTRIQLPVSLKSRALRNILSGESSTTAELRGGEIHLADLLKNVPFGVYPLDGFCSDSQG